MPSSLRLAILSDQHIHATASPDSWELAKRALRPAAKYDHVVLAGDTFDSAVAMLHDREIVERYLRELGLWHRDRLTIVVGNHDMFHTPHHGSKSSKALEYGRNALSFDAWRWVRDPAVERAFDECVAPLTSTADRLDARRPYPMRKVLGHLAFYAADTVPLRTLSAGNGFWRTEPDALLRAATPEADERRILAIHHPPRLTQRTSATTHCARSATGARSTRWDSRQRTSRGCRCSSTTRRSTPSSADTSTTRRTTSAPSRARQRRSRRSWWGGRAD